MLLVIRYVCTVNDGANFHATGCSDVNGIFIVIAVHSRKFGRVYSEMTTTLEKFEILL